MKYKPETVKKYTKQMLELIDGYMSMTDEEFADVHTCISRGDRKIGATKNVSQPPIISCRDCTTCPYHCYDIKANLRLTNVREARARNWAVMSRDRDRYFDEINEEIEGDEGFRWHQGGDIPDMDYLDRMVKSAERNEGQQQWGYTHSHGMANDYIGEHGAFPENFNLMYSYEGTEPATDNPYGQPEFRCIEHGETPPAGFHACGGDCEWCLKNHHGCPWGESSWCYKH